MPNKDSNKTRICLEDKVEEITHWSRQIYRELKGLIKQIMSPLKGKKGGNNLWAQGIITYL